MNKEKPNYKDCNGCVFYLPKNTKYGGRFPRAEKPKPLAEDFCYKLLRNDDCGCVNNEQKVSVEQYLKEVEESWKLHNPKNKS